MALVSTYVRRLAGVALAGLACAASVPAASETIGGNPGPAYNYVCPNSDDKPALDCYFDAVAHLYTMCKHVKSIEIIEYGYEESMDGTNAAKSESCLAKQKLNMTRPYQAALKQATVSKQAVEGLRSLNDAWLKSLGELTWKKGESDDDYKARTMRPFEVFAERVVVVQTAMQVAALPADQRASAPKVVVPKAAAKGAAKPAAKTAPVAKTAAVPKAVAN